jgi:hypothetical protein
MGVLKFKTQEDIDRHFAKGIGTGDGPNYRPGFLIREFPASRRSSFLPCAITGRELELLDPFDRDYALLVMHFGNVSDIQENMPVHPSRTLAIADALGLQHPRERNGLPKILLTSFVLTTVDATGAKRKFARSLLPEPKRRMSDAQMRVLFTTLEILRVYWLLQGVPWSIVNERQINRVLLLNVDDAFEATQVDACVRDTEGYNQFLEAASRLGWMSAPIEACVRSIAHDTLRSFEESMNFFKLGVWKRDIRFDMTQVRTHTANPLLSQPTFVLPLELQKAA